MTSEAVTPTGFGVVEYYTNSSCTGTKYNHLNVAYSNTNPWITKVILIDGVWYVPTGSVTSLFANRYSKSGSNCTSASSGNINYYETSNLYTISGSDSISYPLVLKKVPQ